MSMIDGLETPLGTLAVGASANGEYCDLWVELRRGGEERPHVMQVCAVTVKASEADAGILHLYPYNTRGDDECDDACDDLIVHTDGDRWY